MALEDRGAEKEREVNCVERVVLLSKDDINLNGEWYYAKEYKVALIVPIDTPHPRPACPPHSCPPCPCPTRSSVFQTAGTATILLSTSPMRYSLVPRSG